MSTRLIQCIICQIVCVCVCLIHLMWSYLFLAIDGDGMVVAVTFVNGRVHLRTKFVRTAHRKEESKAHKYLYRGEMGTHPNGALKDSLSLLGNALQLKWPQLMYRNPSNTNVFYWGGKVTAAHKYNCKPFHYILCTVVTGIILVYLGCACIHVGYIQCRTAAPCPRSL